MGPKLSKSLDNMNFVFTKYHKIPIYLNSNRYDNATCHMYIIYIYIYIVALIYTYDIYV